MRALTGNAHHDARQGPPVTTAAPNGSKCSRCLAKGHNCPAARIEDGEYLCIWCLDDMPCDFERYPGKACGERVPPKASARRRNEGGQGPRASAQPTRIAKEAAMPNGVYGEKKKCATEGCAHQVTIGRCKSGYCAKHFYLSKKKSAATPRQQQPKTASRASGKANGHAAPLPEQEQAPRTFPLHVSEPALDRFLLSMELDWKEFVRAMPAEMKLALVNQYFALGLDAPAAPSCRTIEIVEAPAVTA